MSEKRMKQVDRVKWRLLSESDRDKLVQITLVRSQKISTVLRVLARRFDGNVEAYWREACQPNGAASMAYRLRKPRRLFTSAELSRLLRPFAAGGES